MDEPKVFDIARPTATPATRPVISSGPPAPDPMMVKPAKKVVVSMDGESAQASETSLPASFVQLPAETPPAVPTTVELPPTVAEPPVENPLDSSPVETVPLITNIVPSDPPSESPAAEAAPPPEPSGLITPALPGAPASDFGNVPKFGELQPKVDAHPLFSGTKERRVKIRRTPRFVWPPATLLIILIIAYLAIDAGVVRGASHLPFHVFKQKTIAASAPEITPSQTASSAQNAPAATPAATDPYAGWLTYEDKTAGFALKYPKEYGQFTKKTDSAELSDYFVSATPQPGSLQHVSGAFVISDYKTAAAAIPSYKYGPTIQLKDGAWVVVKADSADPNKYKAGDKFHDLGTSQTKGSPAVYTIQSSNEGGLTYIMVFVSGSTLHTITMPEFDTGQGLGSSSATTNDQTGYDNLYKLVRDSLSPAA